MSAASLLARSIIVGEARHAGAMPVIKKPAAAEKMQNYVAMCVNPDLDIADFYKVKGGGTVCLEWDLKKRPSVTKCPGKGHFPTYSLSIKWNPEDDDWDGHVKQARFVGWTLLKELKKRHGN